MIGISILAKKQILLGFPLTLMFLAIACSRNSPPSTQKESPQTPPIKYRWSERQLTPDELTHSLAKLDQDIDQDLNSEVAGGLYQDRRTPEQKKEINTFSQAWASIDPTIAPFLGIRRVTQSTLIYPSLQKGRVCILKQYVDESSGERGVLFSLGTVNKGILQTTSNQTIIARNGLLAVLSIRENKPQFSLLPHALPLPIQAPEVKGRPDITKQFEESQCQFTAPS